MTKKIRKYKKYCFYNEPIFNSSYLFVPIMKYNISPVNLSLLRYDI